MSKQIYDKRTRDVRTITVDCRGVLNPSETITAIASVSADQGGMTFGTAVANIAPVSVYDQQGVLVDTIPIGQAVQVVVSDGVIPAGSPFLLCYARAEVSTTVNSNVEATFGIRLIDNPVF